MNKKVRIVIVGAVVVVVGVAIALKPGKDRPGAPPAEQTADGPSETPNVNTEPSAAEQSPAETPKPATADPTGANPTRSIPRLVDLGADKCIPCKMMAPILEELRTEYAGSLQVDVYDVWRDRDVGRRYGIRVIPTQIFYDASGEELWRHEGFLSKEDILTKWKELGVELSPGSVNAK